MADRSGDWLSQAERDLAQAEESRAAGRHEWACFAAHQSADKAVKAVHLKSLQEVRGHTLSKLLDALPASLSLPADLLDRAKVLDNFYIPTRYPDGHDSGAPHEHYGPFQSADAIQHARAILDFARAALASRG